MTEQRLAFEARTLLRLAVEHLDKREYRDAWYQADLAISKLLQAEVCYSERDG